MESFVVKIDWSSYLAFYQCFYKRHIAKSQKSLEMLMFYIYLISPFLFVSKQTITF